MNRLSIDSLSFWFRVVIEDGAANAPFWRRAADHGGCDRPQNSRRRTRITQVRRKLGNFRSFPRGSRRHATHKGRARPLCELKVKMQSLAVALDSGRAALQFPLF